MRIKVYGGTPANENLCDSCKHSRVIQGHRQMDEIRSCAATKRDVPFPVAKCSYFQEKEREFPDGAINLRFDHERDALVIQEFTFLRTIETTVTEYLQTRTKQQQPTAEPERVQ